MSTFCARDLNFSYDSVQKCPCQKCATTKYVLIPDFRENPLSTRDDGSFLAKISCWERNVLKVEVEMYFEVKKCFKERKTVRHSLIWCTLLPWPVQEHKACHIWSWAKYEQKIATTKYRLPISPGDFGLSMITNTNHYMQTAKYQIPNTEWPYEWCQSRTKTKCHLEDIWGVWKQNRPPR